MTTQRGVFTPTFKTTGSKARALVSFPLIAVLLISNLALGAAPAPAPTHSDLQNPFNSPWASDAQPQPVTSPAPAAAPGGAHFEQDIPQRPSTPPALGAKAPEETFHCQRSFTFRGKHYDCDSYVRMDGEHLRSIIRDVPSAVTELNIYQANRIRVRNAAYVGGAGLLIAIGGLLLSTQFQDTGTQAAVRNVSTIGGLSLAAGAFLYSLGYIRSNERHLVSAVDNFNQSRPTTPIQLQLGGDRTPVERNREQ